MKSLENSDVDEEKLKQQENRDVNGLVQSNESALIYLMG